MPAISLLDYAMFLTETRENPRHVAGLMIFALPTEAPASFLPDLVTRMRAVPARPPFNWRLAARLGAFPAWEETQPDMRKHVRLLHLPSPGGLRELTHMVSELHEEMFDRERPVWGFYVIEGVSGGRFALYSKIHHAYADGATMTRWLDGTLSRSAQHTDITPVWGIEAPAGRRHRRESLASVLEALGKAAGRQLLSVAELYTLLLKHSLKALHLRSSKVPIPFTAPRTLLNQKLTPARSCALAALPLERLRTAGRAAGASINDVVLALCDAALTRYLAEHGGLPEKPLVAEMPVDLRREAAGEGNGGNLISILLVEMATKEMSPLERLRTIHDSTRTVLHEFSALSQDAVTGYTLIVQILAQLGDSLGLADRLPPLGNLVISNVPGPSAPLYLDGARMTGIYPLSTVAPGTVMNITVFSYTEELFFGVVAGKRAIPDLQKLVDYIPTAFAELEQEIGAEAKPRGRPRSKRKRARADSRSQPDRKRKTPKRGARRSPKA